MQYIPQAPVSSLQPSVYFLHIPKTAGTTLISFLDAQFASADICPAQLLPDLFAMNRRHLGDYNFYRGHLWYGLDRYLGRPLRYLTMLRDPLRRTLSWYSHVCRDPNAYRHDRVVQEGWSLLDFLTDSETRWDLVNTQTLFLAVDLDYERLAADPVGYGRDTVRAYAGRGNDPALLELAKRRLASMEFGITERMRDSLCLFSQRFAFDPGMPAQQLNVSPKPACELAVSDAVRAAVEEVTVLDRALYAWAKEQFAARFDAMVDALVAAQAERMGCLGRAWRSPLQPVSLSRVGVESVQFPDSLCTGDSVMLQVTVRNDSRELLSSRPPHPIHIGYHWLDADSSAMEVFDGERTVLPSIVAPGDSLVMPAHVRAPEREGRFRLQVRLVQEGVTWIESSGPMHDPEITILAP